jgi:hypothetical protein
MAYNLIKTYPTTDNVGIFRNLYNVISDAFYYRDRQVSHKRDVKLNRYKEVLLVDCSSGNITVTLPSTNPTRGDWFTIVDSTGNSSVYNITIDFESTKQKLYSEVQNCVVNTNNITVDFVYYGDESTGWILR